MTKLCINCRFYKSTYGDGGQCFAPQNLTDPHPIDGSVSWRYYVIKVRSHPELCGPTGIWWKELPKTWFK